MAEPLDDDGDSGVYQLEKISIDDDSDEDYKFEEVEIDDDDDDDDDDVDDLDALLSTLQKDKISTHVHDDEQAPVPPKQPSVTRRPEVIDDFIRNILYEYGLTKTLDGFQSEWHEKKLKGELPRAIGDVPDVYVRNQALEREVKALAAELENAKEIAHKARSTWDKFRKERDFHKMHHKRVNQEKNRLIKQIQRLKEHYAKFDPMLQELRHKYQVALKEKMLMKLERDKIANKVEALEANVKQLESRLSGDLDGTSPTGGKKKKTKPAASVLPKEDRANPYATLSFEAFDSSRLSLYKTFKGHLSSVSSMVFHPNPKKHVLVTASDDCTWKMWTIPKGELIMTGDGHLDWVSDVDFHPKGTHLATSSGDKTVKIWDFASQACSLTLDEHTQAVWSVAFHDQGDFVASASMDHTARLWDVLTGKCRQTLRGHVDSVNWVCWQPYTNNIITASGDKTISIWDARTGLCAQTFYGHMNACNHAVANLRGDTIASTDADGVVKLWDVRKVCDRGAINAGPHPANKAAFDRSGEVVAVASDDGTCKLYNLSDPTAEANELQGHEDAVQGVLFDQYGKILVTCGSDATFRVWTRN